MALADDIQGYVEDAVLAAMAGGPLITAAGTVASSPNQVSTDLLTVYLDGSAVAVPCKMFRAFPIFPGMRVGLVRIGSDWVVVGSFTDPGAGTGEQRLAIGADVPPELKAYGIQVAMLLYDTDKTSGLEVGYFFVAVSNTLDASVNEKVMLFGSVKYPTPGDPTSATSVIVKTAHQINMNGFTWFKDFAIQIQGSVPSFKIDSPLTLFQGAAGEVEFTSALTRVQINAPEVWVRNRLFPNNEHLMFIDGTVSALTATGGAGANVLIPGTAKTDVVKELAGTRHKIEIHGTAFKTTSAFGRLQYGLRITDNNAGGALVGNYDVGRYGFSAPSINVRQSFSNIGGPYAAFPAGSYTTQLYFRSGTAGESFSTAPAEDCWSYTWTEIY